MGRARDTAVCSDTEIFNLLHELADEIERLRAERDALNKEMEWCANKCNELDSQRMQAQARIATALEQAELAITWPERQDEPFQDILYRIRAALTKEQG